MAKYSSKRSARLALPWERAHRPFRLFVSRRRFLPALGVAALCGLVFTTYRLGGQRADVHATRAMLAEVEAATRAFITELGRCPQDASELVHPPKSGTQYLSEPPLDAWGRAPHLRCEPGEHAEIEVLSAGPSGSFLDDDNVM
jgi:Type II secretion system (T2SS), protein G